MASLFIPGRGVDRGDRGGDQRVVYDRLILDRFVPYFLQRRGARTRAFRTCGRWDVNRNRRLSSAAAEISPVVQIVGP